MSVTADGEEGAEGAGVSPVCPLFLGGRGGMPAVRCAVMGCNGTRAAAAARLLEGVFWGRKVGKLGFFLRHCFGDFLWMGAGCCFEEVMTLCIWARWTAPSCLHRAGTDLGWDKHRGHRPSMEEDEGAI